MTTTDKQHRPQTAPPAKPVALRPLRVTLGMIVLGFAGILFVFAILLFVAGVKTPPGAGESNSGMAFGIAILYSVAALILAALGAAIGWMPLPWRS